MSAGYWQRLAIKDLQYKIPWKGLELETYPDTVKIKEPVSFEETDS